MTRPNTQRFSTAAVPDWATEGAELSPEEKAPELKKGWLNKQGGDAATTSFTNWKKRFFVLEEGVLIYYENEDEKHPCKYRRRHKQALPHIPLLPFPHFSFNQDV